MTTPPGPPGPAGPDGDTADRLPCGRSRDELLEQVFAGRAGALDEHQRGCPHCRAELARLQGLLEPHLDAARRPEEPPAALLPAVVAAVRRAAGQGWAVEAPGARGTTRISSAVVAAVAERAALRVPQVRTAAARPLLEDGADATGGEAPRLAVRAAVVVTYGTSVLRTADAVRAAVRAELLAVTSVAVPVVDVHVADVVELPGPDPR